MRPQSQTINLGEKTYTLRPLTLGQVRDVEPFILDGKLLNIDRAIAVVKIGLARDYPEDAAALSEDSEITGPEIGAAMNAVLALGGFIPDEEASKTGEAPAAAP